MDVWKKLIEKFIALTLMTSNENERETENM